MGATLPVSLTLPYHYVKSREENVDFLPLLNYEFHFCPQLGYQKCFHGGVTSGLQQNPNYWTC